MVSTSGETSAEKAVRYEAEASSLVESCSKKAAEEEIDYRVGLEEAKPVVDIETSEVPDGAAAYLARFIQGSRQPLTRLAETARSALIEESVHLKTLKLEAVSNRMKLIAQRKAYGVIPKSCVLNEDESNEALWHWEVTSNELLGTAVLQAKEARSLRKKIGARLKALRKLIEVLVKHPDDAAKISKEEERVLKFQREDEAARLKLVVQQKKRQEKEAEEERKLVQKQEEEARRLEKKRIDQEAKQKKLEAKQKKFAVTQQQQNILMAFVNKAAAPNKTKITPDDREAQHHPPSSSTEASPSQTAEKAAAADDQEEADGDADVDVDAEKEEEEKENCINRTLLFVATGKHDPIYFTPDPIVPLPRQAIDLEAIAQAAPMSALELAANFRREAEEIAKEKRRCRSQVKVQSEDVDDDVIVISDRAPGADRAPEEPSPKFFYFYNEYRGAYYDYTNRVSSVVSGSTPFARDPEIDYDYDSDEEVAANEAEVEDAEDLNDDEDLDDEEDEDEDDDDGFLANDEEEDDDEDDDKPPTTKRRRLHLIVEPGFTIDTMPPELAAYLPIVFYDPTALQDSEPTKVSKKANASNAKRDAADLEASAKKQSTTSANKKAKPSKEATHPGQIKLTSFFKKPLTTPAEDETST